MVRRVYGPWKRRRVDKTLIRVLVADDHPVVRVGVRMELEKTEDVAVVGEAGSGAEVLRLARELVPDVLLLDMAMPDLDGVAVASQLRETHPSVRVLVFSGYIDDAFVFGALRAGAVGYLLKDEMLEQLGDAVRQAMAGKIVLSDRVAKKTVDRAVTERLAQESPMSLTDRELEVVKGVARFLTNEEIAKELDIVPKTVEYHLVNIRAKLGMPSRREVARWAWQNGLVKP